MLRANERLGAWAPRRLGVDAVIALKRHPAVRAVLDDFVHWKAPKENDEKLPRSRARLLHLWGDRDRLLRIIDASGGVLPERAVAALQKHTRIQFETTTEKQMRHVDAARLVALDGKKLDSGTPTEDVHTDAEDVPVLFELVRRGALPEVKLPTYDHIVIDEGQLRSPLELAAIGDALARDGTVTLAGDHRQATDETAYFAGWTAARAELRTQRWDEITLAITYRSVPAIGEFARSISERRPSMPRDPSVCTSRCAGHLAQAAMMCWHLDALQTRDPWRQIAVIARNPEHAKRLMNELSRGSIVARARRRFSLRARRDHHDDERRQRSRVRLRRDPRRHAGVLSRDPAADARDVRCRDARTRLAVAAHAWDIGR